ncbi:hypothetical protein [Klebsiella sp. BIGb0407]|uniref:hypothetical protein n=1 Tax=Klebsiella sp. BIGb0407 TaxID=2940603 RepID=UPI0021679CE8|nr:hypothetical protein [Klebsiella sp. BIGb0407]MCS3433871.1 hypothetical protein [Klebsiella sp. BIGb0407]
MKKLLLLLLIANGSANAGVEFLYSGMFSFGGSAAVNSGITIDHSGEMEIEPTGSSWRGVSENDGQTRTISTMRYRFPGTITATFPRACYKSSGASWAMAGWGVYQPSVVTSFTQSMGALYSSPGSPQSAGSYYKIEWASGGAVPEGYQFTFRGQSLAGYVYVTTGPSGIYFPDGNRSKPTYVHSSQDIPNARPYLQVDYSGCDTIFRLGDPPLPTPPIIDPSETIACNFSIDGNINLGTVDTTTALGTQGSTKLYTQCNGNTSVTATIGKSNDRNTNIITTGGLTIPVYFSSSGTESKTVTYAADETLRSQNVTAKITASDTLIPGEYTQSMIITLNYE